MNIKPCQPILVFLACLHVTLLGCGTPEATQTAPVVDPAIDANASSGPVTFSFESPDSVREWVVDDVVDGSTLETVMRTIQMPQIEISGSGPTAFVNSIDGIMTSGDKGWTFKIDDEFANQGIGATVLHPPTKVTWTFGSLEAP
ncbi:DUF4430 domain-containing protein [Stieleria varia]|uniref:Transcobalamin-like C-terminal domain-containing protein n=1 Tax=Stieleria varia TaxID=2528005 RepID=A0A5C6AY83_9BACT|nr:DUF4430 domain-containing protein [Stieleria varia]TWU04608.1 hypothetical protein Pla52n_26500 [Stieleria varia]